jgi:hypothetical protein
MAKYTSLGSAITMTRQTFDKCTRVRVVETAQQVFAWLPLKCTVIDELVKCASRGNASFIEMVQCLT